MKVQKFEYQDGLNLVLWLHIFFDEKVSFVLLKRSMVLESQILFQSVLLY